MLCSMDAVGVVIVSLRKSNDAGPGLSQAVAGAVLVLWRTASASTAPFDKTVELVPLDAERPLACTCRWSVIVREDEKADARLRREMSSRPPKCDFDSRWVDIVGKDRGWRTDTAEGENWSASYTKYEE